MIITATYDTMTKACEIKADGSVLSDAIGLGLSRMYSYDNGAYSDKYSLEIMSRTENEDGSIVMSKICASENGDLVEVVETPKEKAEVLKEISDYLTPKK